MLAKVRPAFIGLLLVAVLALTPFRLLKVDGRSMEPTFANGDTYLLDHFYWKLGGLRRNDIVVVRHGQEKWVKRLMGMPGDRLQIQYGEDDWIVDVANLTAGSPDSPTAGLVVEKTVPPGEIFIVGDNLNWSSDSTTQEAGVFRLHDVIGVVRTFALKRDFPIPVDRRARAPE